MAVMKDEEDDDSVMDDALSGEFSIPDEPQDVQLAEKENTAVRNLRLVVFLVLIVVAVAVSASVYLYSKTLETETFEKSFGEQAAKVVDAFQANAERRLAAMEAFADQITSHSLSTNETFPCVTLPNFEIQGGYTRKQAGVLALLVLPIVSTEDRSKWEAYSVANQGWLTEGLAVQASQNVLVSEEDDSEALTELNNKHEASNVVNETEFYKQMKITPVIFRVEPGKDVGGVEPGP